jgi:hypothetical protein
VKTCSSWGSRPMWHTSTTRPLDPYLPCNFFFHSLLCGLNSAFLWSKENHSVYGRRLHSCNLISCSTHSGIVSSAIKILWVIVYVLVYWVWVSYGFMSQDGWRFSDRLYNAWNVACWCFIVSIFFFLVRLVQPRFLNWLCVLDVYLYICIFPTC